MPFPPPSFFADIEKRKGPLKSIAKPVPAPKPPLGFHRVTPCAGPMILRHCLWPVLSKRCLSSHLSPPRMCPPLMMGLNRWPRPAYSSTRREDWDPSTPITVTFVSKDGERHEVTGPTGQDLLTLAHDNGVELEGTIRPKDPAISP